MELATSPVLKRKNCTIVEFRLKDYASDNSLSVSTNPIASDNETINFYQDFSLDSNHENNSLIRRPLPFFIIEQKRSWIEAFLGLYHGIAERI